NGGIPMNLPKVLLYSDEPEWVIKEDGRVRLGITDFAKDDLGDIVFVELHEVGEEVEADEPFGSVESVKTVSELYAQVSGKVVEVNEELEDHPEFVNESPYEKAWMIVVEPTNESEFDELRSADGYKEF